MTFMPMPLIDEDNVLSESTLEFLEFTRTFEKKYKCVVRACVDSRKKRYELLDNAHIKISEFVNNAVRIGEDYYPQTRGEIEDILFEMTNAVIVKYG